jgi:transposase-like protein
MLGLWIEKRGGQVLDEQHERTQTPRVQDMLLAAVDGITGFPDAIAVRKAVYTTKALESVKFTIQKIIRHRQSFPNDQAAMNLMFMGLKNTS